MVCSGGGWVGVALHARCCVTTIRHPQTCGVSDHRGRTPLVSIAAGILGIAGWRLRSADASARRHVRLLGALQLLLLV